MFVVFREVLQTSGQHHIIEKVSGEYTRQVQAFLGGLAPLREDHCAIRHTSQDGLPPGMSSRGVFFSEVTIGWKVSRMAL